MTRTAAAAAESVGAVYGVDDVAEVVAEDVGVTAIAAATVTAEDTSSRSSGTPHSSRFNNSSTNNALRAYDST